MKAITFSPETGPVVVDVPDPVPGPGEVAIRVEACGICGSDRHVVQGAPPPPGARFPVILGHEMAGTIVATGKDTEGWKAGDRVAVYPFIGCGHCASCRRGELHLCPQQQILGFHRPGGYAQFVTVPQQNVVRIPDAVPFAAAALLTDAFATALHALRGTLSALGETAAKLVVIGAGGIGRAGVYLSQILGFQAVGLVRRPRGGSQLFVVGEGPSPTPRDSAKSTFPQLGQSGEPDPVTWYWQPADTRTLAREIRRWSTGGPDCVLDTVGTQESVNLALTLLRPGGEVRLVGMESQQIALPASAHFVRRAYRIAGSYGSSLEDLRQLLTWAQAGLLQPGRLVAGGISLNQAAVALRGSAPAGRLVVQPWS